jgi:hypothetical protein
MAPEVRQLNGYRPVNILDQELIDLDRGWVAAYLEGSADLFNRIWTERFVFTFPFGQFDNKEREISNINSGSVAFESLSSDNLTVTAYGNTVVMTGDFIMKGQYKGRDVSGRYSYTNVLGKLHDELWQIVSSHASLLTC